MNSLGSAKRSRDEFEADQGPRFDAVADNKKQHVDPITELIANVCKDIRRIGENANLANQIDDISYITNPIVAEFEKIDKMRNAVLNTMYAIVIEQPQKINSLSNLVFICNAKNFVVAKYVLEFFHSKSQEMLDTVKKVTEEREEGEKPKVKETEDAGIFNNLKSILKFLASLAPIIENYSIASILKQFLELAIALQNETPEKRNGIAEELFYNTVIVIPYLLSSEFSEELIKHANDLVELAQNFKIVEDSTVLIQPFDSRLDNYELPYEPKKMMDLIVPSLVFLQGENKDWKPFENKLFLNFAEILAPVIGEALKVNPISNELVKHQLPHFSMPSIDDLKEFVPTGLIDSLWYNNSRLLFQVYNATEFETVPRIDSYFGILFKDLSFDILTNLSFNKNEASIQLSILDLYFSKDLFAPPGSSIDQLSMVHKDNISGENTPPLSTWKIEDIAVESILTMIFQLPKPLHYEIYYYTVLIACCRESPESIAPVFGRAIRFFYKNLETLDYELKIRFLDWMTTQISNFEFSWKWDEWIRDSHLCRNLKYHPKKNFIRNLIAKEVRLSDKKKIKESFVTMNQETNELVTLEEFYQYLNISLFEDETEFIQEYDSQLYGNSDEVKEIFSKLKFEKKERESSKTIVSPSMELSYVFTKKELPLSDISNKVYDFVIAHWKPNNEFNELYNEILTAASEVPGINPERFAINLIIQTYAYIGSRSIYSVVSILSRDINKLKFVSGVPVEYGAEEKKFEDKEVSDESFSLKQNWIIESVFRIWVHQPQVVFLILEYLIEFGILKPSYILGKITDLSSNLVIQNVSCMESIDRILKNSSNTEDFKPLIVRLFSCIVDNINELALRIGATSDARIDIVKEFSEEEAEDLQLMSTIDNQWLIYEYKGLLKTYFRKFIHNNHVDYLEDIKAIFDRVSNVIFRKDISSWLSDSNHQM